MLVCKEHNIKDLIPTYVAPGVVYVSCDKCAYWEPAPISHSSVTVTITHADGTTSTTVH